MPTTLPVRRAPRNGADDAPDFASAITSFPAAVAISIATMIAIEYSLEMLTGMTLVESIARSASTGLPYADPALIGLF